MPRLRLPEFSERLGIGLLGLALPHLFVPTAEDAFRLGQLTSLSLAVFFLALSFRGPFRAGTPLWLGLIYFALRLASQAQGGFSLAWTLEQLLYASAFFWASQRLGDAALRLRLFAALLAGAAISCAYGILQSFGLDPFKGGQMDMGFGLRAYGALGNPDFYGGYLALLAPLALLPFLLEARKAALGALLILALLLSQTRAAWIACAASLAFLLAATYGQWRPRRLLDLGLTLGVAVALFSIPSPFNPGRIRLASRLASAADARSSDAGGRFFLYRASLRIAARRPLLGAGGGNYTRAFLHEQAAMLAEPRNAGEPYRLTHEAHNDFLQVASESGLLALAAFVGVLALLLRRGFRRNDPQLAACGAALAAFGADALFSFPLSVPASAALFWVLAGALAAEEGPPAPPTRPNPALALPFAAVLFFFLRQLNASVLLNHGIRESMAQRLDAGDAALRASIRIEGSEYRSWARLGLNADARGDAAGAAAAFEEECRALDSLSDAWSNWGLALGKLGRLDEAEAKNRRALELNPGSISALGNLGKILYLQGRLAEAEAAYLKGIAQDPAWSQGRFNLAAIYLNSGRGRLAAPQLRELLKNDPGNAEALRLLRGIR